MGKDFDNIVDLEAGTPWPLPPLQVTATLAHKFELLGWYLVLVVSPTSSFVIFAGCYSLIVIQMIKITLIIPSLLMLIGSAKIKITFEKTTVKTKGNLPQLPPLEVPRIPDALRPPSNTGSGEFEVTFVDADTRITRGDRGELRVFVIS